MEPEITKLLPLTETPESPLREHFASNFWAVNLVSLEIMQQNLKVSNSVVFNVADSIQLDTLKNAPPLWLQYDRKPLSLCYAK